MYPEKKRGSHKMARPQQNWGLLTLLTRWASIWTMPNTASPKSEPPCGRAVYPPPLCRQDISSHDIDSVEYVGPGLTWGRILSTCFISMWSNDIKCKYMFKFPLKNLACKELTAPMVTVMVNNHRWHPWLIPAKIPAKLGYNRLNSLWPCNAICWHRSRWILAQEVACCLMEPNHYVNQCWFLVISEVMWH